MLLQQKVKLRWNSKIKKHYVDLGYKFTKMKDEFLVDVNDLTKGSGAKVRVKCDYCNKIYEVKWCDYRRLKEKENIKDCCSNPKCTGEKAKESLTMIYRVDNARKIVGVNDKIKRTNLARYGCENPFSSKDVIKKIRKTNLEKYGVEVVTQNPEIKAKAVATCMERYGVPAYGVLYSREHKGELSPTWKGGVSYHRVERSNYEYRYWRKDVFERDLYTCQCCGDKSGNGHRVELNAHHINNWKDNEDLRYDVKNGITLCDKCHMQFHICNFIVYMAKEITHNNN